MCISMGCVLKCNSNPNDVEYKHYPIAIKPMPYPVHLFEQALAYETSMGVLFSQLAKKNDVMRSIISGQSDPFV